MIVVGIERLDDGTSVVALDRIARLEPGGSVSEPLVLLEHLEKHYGETTVPVRALHDVSLQIPAGEFVVFVGPSGSGKTTLLNIVGGLDQPTAGRAIVAGRDLSRLDERALTRYRRDVVGFVFQFFNLVPTLTARETPSWWPSFRQIR